MPKKLMLIPLIARDEQPNLRFSFNLSTSFGGRKGDIWPSEGV